MATKRMLVDGIHPEETRIVVTSGTRLEEFDFESASRRQLRGNIYLAKVTRVEPSLQAAFIEYGGNRHGFLAFSEIHPDYYQIPVADREALLRDEEAEDRAHAEAEAADVPSVSEAAEIAMDLADGTNPAVEAADGGATGSEPESEDGHIEQAPTSNEPVENVGGADVLEEVPAAPRRRFQRYKIQEVIKRRQVMLVQVVKEERGNKGAALTTYLSLAGRYSVLMPNTSRGGGISRKITNAADRKRLKEITSDLEVPQGMGVILRTAGASRTKAEVKRDFEYLMRLWENVRSLTLRSQAPCLVYEEGSLIKRTIRDLYNKDIDEVFVAGDDAYSEAKEFMNMIMPSHAKNVQLYKDDQPLFSKFGIESQLDQMFSPQVTLPSGGYIVINPTEALVSIDVNSGRSTKEHNIEDTALQTNLEAADEISRQLRLRDLAGLIVIDFIDMMENRSNRAVERKLKDCLKDDRARIQVGRISHFGLMEMSRQRIRFGVVESSTHTCPICQGTGLVRSVESLALMVMRHVEDQVMRRPGQSINVRVPFEVALYILNTKRDTLTALEQRHSLSITINADPKLTGSQFAVEKGEPRVHQMIPAKASEHVKVDSAAMADFDSSEEEESAETELEDTEGEEEIAFSTQEAAPDGAEGEPARRRRRRRRGGRPERSDDPGISRPQLARSEQPAITEVSETAGGGDENAEDEEGEEVAAGSAANGDDEPRRRRRRGRRGGRRNRRMDETGGPQEAASGTSDAVAGTSGEEPVIDASAEDILPVPVEAAAAELVPDAIEAAAGALIPTVSEDTEKPKRKPRARKAKADADTQAAPEAALAAEVPAASADDEKPKRKPRTRKVKADAEVEPVPEAVSPAPPEAETPAKAVVPSSPEPVMETIAASSDGGDGDAAASSRRPRRELPPEGVVTKSSSTPVESAEPKKKGWWQRGFLS